jgi:DNA replication protein DnaC
MSDFTKHSMEKLRGLKKAVNNDEKFAAMLKYLERGIPLRYVESFFESAPRPTITRTYDPVTEKYSEKPVEFNREIIHTILQNLSQWRSSGQNLILCGHNGSGKTHAALYLMSQYVNHEYGTYYSTFKELYFLHNSVTLNPDDDRIELYKAILEVDLIVIDELGKEGLSEPVIAFLETLMKERFYNKKQTILITNLKVALSSDPKALNFFTRYGNSCWDLVREGYQIFEFSKQNDFRAKERLQWRT